MWYVYFLRLNGEAGVYVGHTGDLRRRFRDHQKGLVASTRAHLPAMLVSYVAVADIDTARALERYFKSGSGKAFAYKRLIAKAAS